MRKRRRHLLWIVCLNGVDSSCKKVYNCSFLAINPHRIDKPIFPLTKKRMDEEQLKRDGDARLALRRG